MKQALRVVVLFSFVCAALAAFSNVAQAQRMDIGFGISNVVAPSATVVNTPSGSFINPSLSGGIYPGFSGNVLFYHNAGIGAEVFWRASRVDYAGAGFDFRPLLWDINAVYSPKLGPHAYLELVGGIGALSTRFYTGTTCGIYTCSNYQSVNHFDVDLGGGIKLYAHGGFFIRPEARYYFIHNNQEFSSGHAGRAGVTIGYTLK